jgi:uncharacterized membrane protein
MSTWKYVQDGQERGPVDAAELQRLLDSRLLSGETLVWKEGFANWIPVKTIPDFQIPEAPIPQIASGQSVGGPSGSPGAPGAAPPLPVDLADVEQNKVYAVLAYIGLLFLVPLLAAPNSKFARYHTNQGVVLFLATVIAMAGSMVLAMIPLIGCIAGLLPIAIGGGALVLMILGIINAANGEYKPLPMIGHFEILK